MSDFSKLKLFDGGRAPNPRRVQIFLAEKRISIATQQIDINKLEQRSDAFSALNPMQRVPILILEDGTAVAESVAICRYFEEMQPEPRLMGSDIRSKVMIEMWQRRIEFGFLLPVSMAFRHLHPSAVHLESPQVAEWGQVNQKRAREFMSFLDGELAGRPFMAGDHFSIADITAVVAYQFLKPARIGYPEDLPNLQKWFEAISTRPSVFR
jgi:glutathione S-transferase